MHAVLTYLVVHEHIESKPKTKNEQRRNNDELKHKHIDSIKDLDLKNKASSLTGAHALNFGRTRRACF